MRDERHATAPMVTAMMNITGRFQRCGQGREDEGEKRNCALNFFLGDPTLSPNHPGFPTDWAP